MVTWTPWGEQVIPARFEAALDFYEGLDAVREQGRWGYIGVDGAWVIPPRFATAAPFARGFAAVSTDDQEGGRYFWIDQSGAVQETLA